MWYRSRYSSFELSEDGLKSDAIHQHLPDLASVWGKSALLERSIPLERSAATGVYDHLLRVQPKNYQKIDYRHPLDFAADQLGQSVEEFPDKSRKQFMDIHKDSLKGHGLTPEQQAKLMVDEWNVDGNLAPTNLAFQLAANDLFGLNAPIISDTNLAQKRFKQAQEIYRHHGAGMRDFLQAQYNHTQKTLGDLGLHSVPLYRGMHVKEDQVKYLNQALREGHHDLAYANSPTLHENVPIHLQPLSSHTMNPQTARGFAAGLNDGYLGLIHRMEVPKEKILSTPYTGFGEDMEAEAVVLGGLNHTGQAITMPYANTNPQDYFDRYNQINTMVQPWMDESDAAAEAAKHRSVNPV